MQETSAKKSVKWTDKKQYSIGKYVSKYGNNTTVRNFQKKFPNIKESTVRKFKKRFEKQLRKQRKTNLQPATLIERYNLKTEQPLLLGKFHSIVQKIHRRNV